MGKNFIYLIMVTVLFFSGCRSVKDQQKSQVKIEQNSDYQREDKSQNDIKETVSSTKEQSSDVKESTDKEQTSDLSINKVRIEYDKDGNKVAEEYTKINKTDKSKETGNKSEVTNINDSLGIQKDDKSQLNIKEKGSNEIEVDAKTDLKKEKTESTFTIQIAILIFSIVALLVIIVWIWSKV